MSSDPVKPEEVPRGTRDSCNGEFSHCCIRDVRTDDNGALTLLSVATSVEWARESLGTETDDCSSVFQRI